MQSYFSSPLRVALAACILPVFLSSCSHTSSMQRDPVSPAVSSEFEAKGHLERKGKPEEVMAKAHDIPKITQGNNVLPPMPTDGALLKKYSVSAVNIPVNDLLFKLAKDANKQLDLYSGVSGVVTINALNQDLTTILKRISEQSGFLFSIEPDRIVIRPDKPFWHNYFIDYVNIKKTSSDTIDMKMSVGGAAVASGGTGTGGSSSSIQLVSEHDFWAELEGNLSRIVANEQSEQSKKPEEISSEASESHRNVVVNEEAGVIAIYGSGQTHRAVKSYLSDVIARAAKQVLIEATVVEVKLSDQYQAGIDWSSLVKASRDQGLISQTLIPTNLANESALTFNLNGINGDWSLGLKLLQEFGNTKVLSSPKIMAVNNQTALLKVVDNEVYFTIEVDREAATATSAGTTTYETEVHTVPVGFMMSVTPFVSNDDSVSLNIRPTITRIVGYANDPSPDLANAGITSRIPVIQEREMASVLRLNNKQTAVIGGLIEDANTNDKNAVPWINQVPVLGDLFSYKDDTATKSELVIFIRPVVVKKPDIDHGDLQALRTFLKTQRPQ